MDDLVSIVMPVYNTSQYLEKSILSVINQTYRNIELIIVDDKSTDNSVDIIKKYAKLDNRIVPIYRKQNEGLSASRNSGIKIARGKYITFMDSDDLFSDNFALQNAASKFQCDIQLYIFSLKRVKLENDILSLLSIKQLPDDIIKLDQLSFLKVYFRDVFSLSACNKIYLLNILIENSILFDEKIRLGEDQVFNAHYFLYVNKILTIKDSYYLYIIHHNSLCRSSYNSSFIKNNYNILFESYLSAFYSGCSNDIDVWTYINVMMFTNKFVPISRHYFNVTKLINQRLPQKYYNCSKKHVTKKLDINDYYFALSYFYPLYRYTIYVLISLVYYFKKICMKIFK